MCKVAQEASERTRSQMEIYQKDLMWCQKLDKNLKALTTITEGTSHQQTRQQPQQIKAQHNQTDILAQHRASHNNKTKEKRESQFNRTETSNSVSTNALLGWYHWYQLHTETNQAPPQIVLLEHLYVRTE